MSLVLSSMMSGWVTWINLGWSANFLMNWSQAFYLAWPAAALISFFIGPEVHKLSTKFSN